MGLAYTPQTGVVIYTIDNNNKLIPYQDTTPSQPTTYLEGAIKQFAFDQNDLGQRVGYSEFYGEDYTATVWNVDGTVINLGSATSSFTIAEGVNNNGQIVGKTFTSLVDRDATLWDKGVAFNLNDLVSNSILGNWRLVGSYSINDNGWIVGFMYDLSNGYGFSSYSSFLLTPDAPSAVPLPAAGWLFGSALGGFGMIRRRKV